MYDKVSEEKNDTYRLRMVGTWCSLQFFKLLGMLKFFMIKRWSKTGSSPGSYRLYFTPSPKFLFFFFWKKKFFFLNLRPNFIYTPGRGLGCRRLLWLFPGPLHPQELQTQPFPAVNLPGHSSWNLRSHSRCLPLPTHLLCPEIPPLPGLLPNLSNSLKDNPNTLSPWLPDCESDCVSPLFKIQQFPLHFKGTDQTPQFKAFRG